MNSYSCSGGNKWNSNPPCTRTNYSARQFRQSDIAERISLVLQLTGLAPDMLELEMTESLLMDHSLPASNAFGALSRLGVRIALDDFGTGYSSLAYLKRFPINTLKIDRSFVKDLTTNANDVTIAHAIIALAHSLQVDVIAEGVESEEQERFFRQQGCTQIQGYLISRPLPTAEDLGLWINKMIHWNDYKDNSKADEMHVPGEPFLEIERTDNKKGHGCDLD